MKRLKMVQEFNKKSPKINNQNNQIKSNNKRKINSSEKQYIQAKEKNSQIQENNFNNQLTETEEKILYLWKILGVTKEYQEKFSIKLNIFHPDFHPFILEEEKKNLEKIFNCISKITNADITREKNIKELKKLNIISQNEKTYSTYDEINNEIKRCLRNLKSSLLSIFINISILRQLTTYDLINNKYDLTKISFNKYFDKDYLLKLNHHLLFIREGQIGKIFKLTSPFDPLLIEFIDNDNETNLKNSINKESLYVLFKDLVLTGYNPVQKNVRGIRIIKNSNHKLSNNNTNSTKLLNINNNKNKEEFDKSLNELNNSIAKKNIKEKEIIEAKEKNEIKNKKYKLLKKNEENEDLNVPEVNDDYINDHDINFKNLEQKNEAKIFFYNGDINDLNKNYEIFFENIPKNQKNTFYLKNDIKNYLYGNNPMILLKTENNYIISLMCLSYSSDTENTLNINTFCTLNEDNQENEKIFSEFISFINEKNIKYQFLTIDLYYDLIDGKFVLDKNINNIFKNLNFRWSKLENLESGVRYQQMKFVNNNFNPDNDVILDDKVMNIQSSLILYFNDNNNNNDNIDFTKNTNTFHLEVLDNLNNKNEENMNKFKMLFKNLFFSDNNEEIQQLLSNNNFNFVHPEFDKKNKILISLFNIFPQFESAMITEINNQKYIRIQTKIEVLYEKETNQLFYMIICSKDSNALLIAEVNEKFNKIISNGNIYYNFKDFYPKIENYQKQYEAIYIPLINNEKLTDNKGSINNITGVEEICEFWKITSGINYSKNNFILNPGENDIVIRNSCFLSLMNIDIADEFNISTVFCSFINFT